MSQYFFMAKPFNPLELMARVKSQLRRYRELNPSKPHERQEVISLKHLEINKVTHQVVCYGESIKLTPIEFDILYLLASNPGRVFGTDEIFERVWHSPERKAGGSRDTCLCGRSHPRLRHLLQEHGTVRAKRQLRKRCIKLAQRLCTVLPENKKPHGGPFPREVLFCHRHCGN